VLEREAKLLADEAFELPPLDQVASQAKRQPAVAQRIEDVYYDTVDLRLLRWGCTLRHRNRQGWTVKLPVARSGAALIRNEINFQGPADQLPEPAVDLVASFSRGHPLQAVATVSTDRTAHSWTGADGELVVELAEDAVQCEAANGIKTSFHQIEAELGPNVELSILDDFIDQLTAAGAQPDPGGIKVAKVLGADARGAPDVVVPPLGDWASAREVIQRAIARSVRQLITELPAAQVGADPGGVHQARVATRRLRSDLRTFRPLLDASWATALQQDLRPLAAHLGRVRDTDVLLQLFRTTLDEHPEIDQQEAQAILGLLELERQASRAVLNDYLARGGIDALLDRLVAAAADPPTRAKADRRAGKQLTALVRERWRRLDEAVAGLGSEPSASDLHDVRILTKRTRYAAEAIVPPFGPAARPFIKPLTTVQDILGDHNDAMVGQRWLAKNAHRLEPGPAFAAGRLIQILLHEAQAGPRTWTVPYGEAAHKRSQRWLR